jgi:hypothetical protein
MYLQNKIFSEWVTKETTGKNARRTYTRNYKIEEIKELAIGAAAASSHQRSIFFFNI